MRSAARGEFWRRFDALPDEVQRQARKQFELWKADPSHRSLQFKPIRPGVFSVRINRNYRALARVRDDLAVWFWIGTHDEYEKLIDQLK